MESRRFFFVAQFISLHIMACCVWNSKITRSGKDAHLLFPIEMSGFWSSHSSSVELCWSMCSVPAFMLFQSFWGQEVVKIHPDHEDMLGMCRKPHVSTFPWETSSPTFCLGWLFDGTLRAGGEDWGRFYSGHLHGAFTSFIYFIPAKSSHTMSYHLFLIHTVALVILCCDITILTDYI